MTPRYRHNCATLFISIARVFERAQAAGKPSGILAPVQADAEHYPRWAAASLRSARIWAC
ncbi:MAG: 2-dehydro-3-deoxyglucarate aldolase (EC [uncultured Paraburkholderia sp.]|nr:MAG: 2-dehydro-3-deoxyglucarate aldolase (EC [uncultured Paraburkholderia sp.]CAH2943629.1 MAG: 2-dehydro-3-deoxyglucarate aldolase (EC [uncultured Paraburkholderia sp.]